MKHDMSIKQHIGGKWRLGRGRELQSIWNPATGELVDQYPSASVEDLSDAVASAVRGFSAWSQVSAWERGRILERAAANIRQRLEQIAEAITEEQGKPLSESRTEVERAADFFVWAAGEAVRIYDRCIPARSGEDQRVCHVPVGPVCAFTPWNYPVVLVAKKIAAALAAGCACVLKPSEETPTAPTLLVRACIDAGVNAQALNLVLGNPSEISEFLISHSDIRKVTFTGSISVGKLLANQAAAYVKPITLELGGHAPVIVMPGCDLEQIVPQIVSKKFHNAGQACISPSRFFVHVDLHEAFVDAFARGANQIVVGPGHDKGVQMGPLANARRRESVSEMIRSSLDSGAILQTGGSAELSGGFFVPPTVLDNVPSNAVVMRDEPFGPVAPVSSFRSLDEALTKANCLEYGLAAYAFSPDPKTQDEIARRLEAGIVGINCLPAHLPELPLGGWKESGLGVEGGAEATQSYLRTKTICRRRDV